MGSIAMDKCGDIAIGYSVSSGILNPAIRYAGRTTDMTLYPLGTLGTETAVVTGVPAAGSQTQSNRWGDYSSMRVDPVDDSTFWYTTEYIPADGNFNWRTYIVRFKFTSCP